MPLHWWGHFIVDLGRQVMHQPGSLLMRRAAFAVIKNMRAGTAAASFQGLR